MVNKPSFRVAAAIIEDHGKYLVARRKEGTHLSGLWEFPGGKCEEGETYESCVRREVLEELGIEITLPRFFMTHRHEYPEKIVELHFYSCSIHQGEPRSLGCSEFNWVQPEDFPNYEFPPADLPVLNQLLERAGLTT